MTAVMGLDLSITATGVCLPDGRVYTVGGLAAAGDHRLVDITDSIARNCVKFNVRLAVLEDLPTHGKGAGVTGMVQGCVRYALQRLGVSYALLSAATLKAYATNKGGASKPDMAVAALKRGQVEFADDNQCDAWWLRQAGLEWLGQPEIQLPQAQRARLDKGKWPAGLSREGITS